VRREVERLEFDEDQTSALRARMDELAAAHDGWINLLPGVAEEDAPTPAAGFFAVFGPRVSGVAMGTWMPARPTRHSPGTVTVGILHPAGSAVVPGLADAGFSVPARWRVRQDHARRGLLLVLPADDPQDEVLSWVLPVVGTLTTLRQTGSWQAEVHLPRTG